MNEKICLGGNSLRLVIRTPDRKYYVGVRVGGAVEWTFQAEKAHRFLNLDSAAYCMNRLPEDIDAEVFDLEPDDYDEEEDEEVAR